MFSSVFSAPALVLSCTSIFANAIRLNPLSHGGYLPPAWQSVKAPVNHNRRTLAVRRFSRVVYHSDVRFAQNAYETNYSDGTGSANDRLCLDGPQSGFQGNPANSGQACWRNEP